MPTYVFQCKECKEQFEKFLKITDRNEPKKQPCPKCNARGTVQKVITATPLLYQPDGQLRTSDNFNDRLKQIKELKSGNGLIETTIETR